MRNLIDYFNSTFTFPIASLRVRRVVVQNHVVDARLRYARRARRKHVAHDVDDEIEHDASCDRLC